MTFTFKERHVAALLNPENEHEESIVVLFSEMARIADRYRNDSVMVPVVEHLGSAIIGLLNGETGRLDPGTIDQQVRDIVARCGGDANNV